jgi:hypothetical protein
LLDRFFEELGHTFCITVRRRIIKGLSHEPPEKVLVSCAQE